MKGAAGKTRPLGASKGVWLFCGVLLAVGALYACAIAVAFISGPRHDYEPFLKIWQSIADGGTPWPPRGGRPSLNVYGPAFDFIAPLVKLDPLAPKAFFTSVWFALAFWLYGVSARFSSTLARAALPAILLLHPYFWVDVPLFGHFDVLVAACCVLGVHALNRGHELRAGVWIALGGCLKLHPFALIPFLALGRDRIRVDFLASAVGSTAVAYAVSWYAWGEGTFMAFGSGATRDSKIMSIFRFLRGEHSPLHLVSDAPNLDFLATGMMGAALVGLLWVHFRRRFETTGAAVVAAAVILSLYPVGHPQLYFAFMVLLGYWVTQSPGRFVEDPALASSALLLCGWLLGVGGMYPALDEFRWGWSVAREWLGLPTFCLMATFTGLALRSLWLAPAAADSAEAPAQSGSEAN